jgi:hypothetical protein
VLLPAILSVAAAFKAPLPSTAHRHWLLAGRHPHVSEACAPSRSPKTVGSLRCSAGAAGEGLQKPPVRPQQQASGF